MTDDRPFITLGHSQIDAVVLWALKDAIAKMEALGTGPMRGYRETLDANLAAMKVAYAYFGGDSE